MHCSACDTWSTRADRCSYCGAVPAVAPQQAGAVSAPVVTGSTAAPAPTPPDPYAPPAPAPTGVHPAGVYPGAYPPAPGAFAPQAPYGMPGAYPASPFGGWMPQPFRSLRGLAVTLYILLPLSAVFAGLCAAAFFHRADVLRQIVDAGDLGVTDSLRTRAEDSDSLVAGAITFLVLSMIATAVLFIIWMYRARANVDLFGPSKQHLSTGWAVGGWLVPVVSLWFPKLILHDVWRASDPRTAERGGRTPGRLPLLWTWWVLLVGASVLFFASRLSYPLGDDIELSDADRLQTIDILSGAADIVLILAAVAAIFVVRKITTFQHEREALAFASGLVPAPGAAGGFPAGAPTPWAAYPAQAPTGQYFAPPVPAAPGAPGGFAPPAQTALGAPPVPQAPVEGATAAAPVAPAPPAEPTPVASAPAMATPVAAPPPRPAAPPTAGVEVPDATPAAAAESSDADESAEAAPAVAPADGEAESVEAATAVVPAVEVESADAATAVVPATEGESPDAATAVVPAAEGDEATAVVPAVEVESPDAAAVVPAAEGDAVTAVVPAVDVEAAAVGASAEPVLLGKSSAGGSDVVAGEAGPSELPQVPAQSAAAVERASDASADEVPAPSGPVDAGVDAQPAPSGERRG
ncbi:DUF4328 domain-containing protein [Embleya sp. NPDC055664]